MRSRQRILPPLPSRLAKPSASDMIDMIGVEMQETEDINAVDCKDDSEEDSPRLESEEEVSNVENCNGKRQSMQSGAKKKRGIIYLSVIPKYMNITKIREIFSAYGKLGRVYLQLAEIDKAAAGGKKRRKSCARNFTEGWIEFESKRVAKYVAATLNNTQVSTRKKSKFYDIIWNIKYLPRFKWVHLSERLAYEKAVRKQRLRTEISQAKREANFFSFNVDKSKKLRRKPKTDSNEASFPSNVTWQRDTDAEIRSRKQKLPLSDEKPDLLKALFG